MQQIRVFAVACLVAPILAATAASPQTALPPPQTQGGKPLMEALNSRKSSRDFRPDNLPPQVLSNLLWAAFGVNRKESGGRTAPSAHDSQEIEVYLATADGLFLFEARTHSLKTIHSGDIRAKTGLQSFVAEAPLDLIYVADLRRMHDASEADRNFYTVVDAGFISENVYLFCASEGLATVVRGSIDRPALARAMRLRPEQRIILAQSVGYPQQR